MNRCNGDLICSESRATESLLMSIAGNWLPIKLTSFRSLIRHSLRTNKLKQRLTQRQQSNHNFTLKFSIAYRAAPNKRIHIGCEPSIGNLTPSIKWEVETSELLMINARDCALLLQSSVNARRLMKQKMKIEPKWFDGSSHLFCWSLPDKNLIKMSRNAHYLNCFSSQMYIMHLGISDIWKHCFIE